VRLRGPRCSVRHSTDRYDFSAQLLDRRAMPHRGLSDKCKRVRFGHVVTAHDLENGGEHDAPGSNTVLQPLDVRGYIHSSLRGIERNP
jgi:hypothetical protein